MQQNFSTRHNHCMDFLTSQTSQSLCGEGINSNNFSPDSDSMPNVKKQLENENSNFQSEDHLTPEMKQKLARDLLRTLTVLRARENFRHSTS